MNPQRIVSLILIFSDVVLALAVWVVAIVVRATWGTSTIAGVLPTNTIAGVLPVAVWVLLRAFLGLYPGYGLNAVGEVRRQSYATLGALMIISTFLGLRPGQDVSRSVLIAGFFGTPYRCSARAAVGEVEPQESKALGELDDHR